MPFITKRNPLATLDSTNAVNSKEEFSTERVTRIEVFCSDHIFEYFTAIIMQFMPFS